MAITEIGVGLVPNDGTGDSIRDAFVKTNQNFTFLDESRQNLVTGNLTATGNITFQASDPSYWTGTYYLNGSEVATVNNLFSGGTVRNPTEFTSDQDSTSNVTGAVTISGGLGVAGNTNLTDVDARNITVQSDLSATTFQTTFFTALADSATGNLTTSGINITTGNLTAANVTAQIQVTAQRAVLSGNLTVGNIIAANTGSFGGNVTTANVSGFKGTFTQVTGTLQTAAQPNITSLGTLTGLAITGNTTAGNISGNIGTFNNMTVQSIPTVKSVTTKEYVTATVVGFAIGLGS
jgi:hypothetical protein